MVDVSFCGSVEILLWGIYMSCRKIFVTCHYYAVRRHILAAERTGWPRGTKTRSVSPFWSNSGANYIISYGTIGLLSYEGPQVEDWITRQWAHSWRRYALPLSVVTEGLQFFIWGVRPCEIKAIHIGTSTGIVSVQILFRQPYRWEFMSAATLSYREDCLTADLLLHWLSQSFHPFCDSPWEMGMGLGCTCIS